MADGGVTTPATPALSDEQRHAMCVVPASLRSPIVGQRCINKLAVVVFDNLLPKLGMGRVEVVPVKEDGKTYYRISIIQPGRTISWGVTPYGAAGLGQWMFVKMMSGEMRANFLVPDNDGTGDVYVPLWAAPRVLEALMQISRIHRHEIEFFFDVPRNNEDEEAEDQQPPVVLH